MVDHKITHICDRCNRGYEQYDYSCSESLMMANGMSFDYRDENGQVSSHVHLDLCENCMLKLEAWLSNGKGIGR